MLVNSFNIALFQSNNNAAADGSNPKDVEGGQAGASANSTLRSTYKLGEVVRNSSFKHYMHVYFSMFSSWVKVLFLL
jgi:hypothetical protein